MHQRSKLLSIKIVNIGCVGTEGLTVELDDILCLVGINNTGKSTVLRAYELAQGSETFSVDKDFCNRIKEGVASVEISVHIPEGIGNIAEKWKEKLGDHLVVRSKWEWDQSGVKSRSTYDPDIKDYSTDDKAAGLDAVFSSRLPKPFRIGALQNSKDEFKNLLNLIVQPIADSMSAKFADKESALSKALTAFSDEARKPLEEHREKIDEINRRLTKNHNRLFPDLTVELQLGLEDPVIKPLDSLAKASKLRIKEWDEEVDWDHQGTGSQRALFWSLLQVRSRLQSLSDFKKDRDKTISELKKAIKKLEGERDKAKKEDTKAEKQEEIDKRNEVLKELIQEDSEKAFETKVDDIALPGYMLLIDEPEIALHPNAIRAAASYLYELSGDPSWQVMISTHSPSFINPLHDHTTVVRLTRDGEKPSPRTYRSDDTKFSEMEVEELKMLNLFDQSLAEMFFGQYPVIIEGDTEFAAFNKLMELEPNRYPLNKRPILVRARGKYTMIPIMKMLLHFQVPFSVLHDLDYPKTKKGKKNNAWTANVELYKAIEACRNAGISVIHRVSMTSFEIAHHGITVEDGEVHFSPDKDKPWVMAKAVKEKDDVKNSVRGIFDELVNLKTNQEPIDGKFDSNIEEFYRKWVGEKGITDARFLLDR